MRNFVKRSLNILFILLGIIVLSISLFIIISSIKYSTLELNSKALTSTSLNIEIYDKNNDLIKEENTFNNKYVKLSSLPTYVSDAFVSIEDKTFYSHKGINPKRIVKALLKNIQSFSYKEGASTISQQLIKNTHLSGEKTINRKLKEISLTRKLEKNFSKDEILEFYLNIIYFGNNNYGIEEASNYYFSKESKDLTLSESALLAGMIKSPSKYSPIKHKENALARRNLVLSEMAKDEKISLSDAIKSKSEELSLNINTAEENKLNSYSEQAIDEAINILKMPAKHIANGGYKIYTYQNRELQQNLKNSFENVDLKGNDYGGIAVDNKTSGIVAFAGKSAYKILENKRQPGSLLKPLLVYAPAIEENIISPSTLILDEPISIGDFCPKNVSGDYKGYISVKDALSMSINVPAVKILSYLGVEKGKEYCKKMNIKFDENDISYALALGGMTYGTTLQEIVSAYTTLANGGKFSEAKFINYILDKNGKMVYKHTPEEKSVFRDDTAYLCNDMLKTSATKGTAKKLSSLNKPLASKTGTVGIKGKKENTDALNVTYSPEYTVGVWTGNLDNKPINISGGNEPTAVCKNFFSTLSVSDFEKPNSVITKQIDLIELEENHIVAIANKSTPERYKKEAFFSRFNEPENYSENFIVPPRADAFIENIGGKKTLIINAKKHLSYVLLEENNETVLNEISNSKEKESIVLEDNKSYILKTSYTDVDLSSEKKFSLLERQNKFPSPNQNKKKWYI